MKEYFLRNGTKVKMSMKQAKSLIPENTNYCNKKGDICPFLCKIVGISNVENGYCSYLDKTDFELNEENGIVFWKTTEGKVFATTGPHEIPCSTLWNGIKMCKVGLVVKRVRKVAKK